MTMAIDPRKGLHRNLNLLEAYQIYEQDYPLFLPDISATLALNSPLFDRINETLTLQSLNKIEFEQDEAQLRAAAMAGGVPLDQLREAFRIFRDAQTPLLHLVVCHHPQMHHPHQHQNQLSAHDLECQPSSDLP